MPPGKTSRERSLAFRYPEIAKEWHPIKNGKITPLDLASGSNKVIWWQCPNGHNWQATVLKRTRQKKNDCPVCRSVGILRPRLAAEWHPTKNGDLSPYDVLLGSNIKVWWKCPKGADHVWQAVIHNRAGKASSGCPYCIDNSGVTKKASKSNNLAILHPSIAKEWHPTKNGDLKPSQMTPGSSRRVWWQCLRDSTHAWETAVHARTKVGGTRCPHCDNFKTSRFEIRVYAELLSVFDGALWREKVDGIECDILIPNINVAVEVDGRYWHRNKEKSDKAKNLKLSKKGITVFRFRGSGLSRISKRDIEFAEHRQSVESLKELLVKFKKRVSSTKYAKRIDRYLRSSSFSNDREYRRLVSYLPGPPPEMSLAAAHKALAKEWHTEKNFPLRPEMFSPGSKKKIWWQCAVSVYAVSAYGTDLVLV